MQLTPRDIQLLLWLNSFGWASILHISRWMAVDYSTAARRIRALERAGLVRRFHVPVLTASPIAVTATGVAAAGDQLPPLRGFRLAEHRHDGMLIDVAFGLLKKFPGSRFEPARTIEHATNGAMPHVPDGYLHHRGDRFIIELELTVKSRSRLDAIIAGHVADLGAKEVWYVTDSDLVANAIRRAKKDHDFVKIIKMSKKEAAAPKETGK